MEQSYHDRVQEHDLKRNNQRQRAKQEGDIVPSWLVNAEIKE